MAENKYLDLEERSLNFSLAVRDFCYCCKKVIINAEYIRHLVRSAGSVGENYIEANDGLGNKDKKMKIKISKKEAKESAYWLKHITTNTEELLEQKRMELIDEANQLTLIFAAILRKLID